MADEQEVQGFDLDQQTALASHEDHGIEIHIHGVDEKALFYEDPETGEQLPVVIGAAGAHSAKFRRTEELIRKRKLKPRQFTGELVYEDNIEKTAACTLYWRGFFVGKEVIRCTPANVKMVYKRCPWVLDQVMEGMYDHARFFENGSTSPASTSSSEQS